MTMAAVSGSFPYIPTVRTAVDLQFLEDTLLPFSFSVSQWTCCLLLFLVLFVSSVAPYFHDCPWQQVPEVHYPLCK